MFLFLITVVVLILVTPQQSFLKQVTNHLAKTYQPSLSENV